MSIGRYYLAQGVQADGPAGNRDWSQKILDEPVILAHLDSLSVLWRAPWYQQGVPGLRRRWAEQGDVDRFARAVAGDWQE